MYKAFLIKYAEIAVKGKNRGLFEEALVSNVEYQLSRVDGEFSVRRENGRVFVEVDSANDDASDGCGYDYDGALAALQRVFGVVGICPVVLVDDNGFDALADEVIKHVRDEYGDAEFTFKVEARRARKNYPMNSMELAAALGERILMAFPKTRVDVHEPKVRIYIEVRPQISIYSKQVPGPGGMPLGTAGHAMLLLSGGIDSPVAGYMISRRGVTIEATYFHAPPYTSERAKQKVIDLAKIVSQWAGPIKLHVVNFTDIQLHIYDKCPHEELTIIMRRYMMRIAEHFAVEGGCLGLVTGESIGQVASQTMQSLYVTDEVCDMPVYRPLIAMDKQDIVTAAEKIGTFETSILPYEDCCTIFVAKHPVTKPLLKRIRISESHLSEQIDALVQTAIATAEIIDIEPE